MNGKSAGEEATVLTREEQDSLIKVVSLIRSASTSPQLVPALRCLELAVNDLEALTDTVTERLEKEHPLT